MIALLVAGFLISTTIAVIEFGQLRAANERIEELETGSEPPDGGDGGPFGELGDFVEDLLGDAEGIFEGTGELGSLLDCLGNPLGGGEAATSIEGIAAQVEQLRELAFENEVEPQFLGDQAMTERVRELFLEEYSPKIADIEQRLLTTLGAIPPGTDLRELRAGAIGQQVAGFYEPETGELVVRQGGADLSALDRITLAHELDHALTDQALGIPLPEDPELGREDANLAALALVEGDATLVMQQYAGTLGIGETFDLLDPAAIAQQEAGLESFPYYLEQELLFPYQEGLSFVCAIYAEGGWDAVNEAYAHPPTSTDQILFPERYLQGAAEPVDPPDPPGPGKGWKLRAELEIGPANLLWLFSAPGGDPSKASGTPREVVGDWRGGEIFIWSHGKQTSLSMVLSGKEKQGLGLCGAAQDWYSSSYDDDRGGAALGIHTFEGPNQSAAIACGNGQPVTALGIGPDLETALELTAVF